MIVKENSFIRTLFLSGIVTEIIDGLDRGWEDTLYFRVKVLIPKGCRSNIVRLDEVREVRDVAS